MPSMFSSAKSKSRHSTSKSMTKSAHLSSSIYDGRMSFSDSSTLIDVDISPDYPSIPYEPPKYAQVIQEDMMDPEDQAWGSPPPMNLKFPFPRFSRSSKSSKSSKTSRS